MSSSRARVADRGPFRADQLRSGNPYELSNGHAILCMPTGGTGSGPNGMGFSAVGWDPAVTEAGVDTGYSPAPGTLRAPDVAIGNVPNKPGWVAGAPELAIEYADVGQDETKLQEKIVDLLGAGTKYLWVVRLSGPRRVEVHQPGQEMRTVLPGKLLEAPGVLKNAVQVEALYDRDAAARATLTNLLQRQGYQDLDAVLTAGRAEGLAEGHSAGLAEGHSAGLAEGMVKGIAAGMLIGLTAVLKSRKIRIPKAAQERLDQCSDLAQLERWTKRAAEAQKIADIFEDG